MKIKKKTLALIAIALVVVVGVASAVIFLQGGEAEIALKENQSYVYAYVSDITGNEMTYSVLDESVVTAYLEQQEEAEEEEAAEAENGDISSSDEEMSVMGEMPSGERPDMSEMSDGERPDMGEMPGDEDSTESGMPSEGEMPDGERPDRDEMSGGNMQSAETVTTLIPVGITVHTQSDTETTFQRLVSGDMIKMLVETTEDGEEVITEIWML